MEINLKDVSYGKILEKINIDIKSGNIVAFIGANGSGKTKLLEIIAGRETDFEGKISIETEETKIQFIQQDLRETFFCDTLEKELEYVLENANYTKSRIRKRINDSIKMIGLPEYFLKRDPLSLSSSELRLAALARALLLNPEIIILDEPIVGMSESEINNLIKIFKKIKRRYSKTIIFASQNMDFVHKISDYIYVIYKNKIELCGDKYFIFKNKDLLLEYNICAPKIMQFENYVLKTKKIKLGYRDDINDLIKDILRNV